MKTLVAIIILTLFFKSIAVTPVKVIPQPVGEPIVINVAQYFDRVCTESGLEITTDPPIEHMLYLDQMIKKYDLPPRLMYRLVYQECKYIGTGPESISPKGAWGYMQTMPATFWEEADKLGLDSSVYSNIEIGCVYMRKMLDKFDNVELALAAYNSGPGRVSQLGRVPNIKETKEYVKFIMQ